MMTFESASVLMVGISAILFWQLGNNFEKISGTLNIPKLMLASYALKIFSSFHIPIGFFMLTQPSIGTGLNILFNSSLIVIGIPMSIIFIIIGILAVLPGGWNGKKK